MCFRTSGFCFGLFVSLLSLTCLNFMYFLVCNIPCRNSPLLAMTPSLSKLHDHTQTHHTRQDSFGSVMRRTQRTLPDHTQQSEETDILNPRRDSNPEPQQASGRRPTPQTTQPLVLYLQLIMQMQLIATLYPVTGDNFFLSEIISRVLLILSPE